MLYRIRSVRFRLTLVAVLLFPFGVSSNPTLAQDEVAVADETIRVDVNLVSLRFSVVNSSGDYMNQLSAADFTVFENGQQVTPAFFEQPRRQGEDSRPLWLAFLLDVSGSTFATRAEEILAARSFFENIHDFTRVGIFGFTDKLIPFQEFTSDRKAALEAFGSARAHLGRTAIYTSLDSLVSLMNSRAGGNDRKSIIVVSDGIDDKYHLVSKSIELARKSGVTVYSVWVPSAAELYIGSASSNEQSGAKAAEKKKKEDAFARLAPATDGRHFGGFEAILDFDEVLAEINDELFGNLYSVGYYTELPHLDRFEREIRVDLGRQGLHIQGLFENLPDRVQTKKRYIEALFDANAIARLPVGEGFREIGADMDLLRQRQEGEDAILPFRIKINAYSLRRERGGGIRTQFGVIGVLTDMNGNEVGKLREVFRASLEKDELRDGRGIIYTNRLLAPVGDYLFKVALLEIPTWRMTVLERPVHIR
ncbi:MAG: VWA domain-containing protein [Acidobacteriota bacterium]|nr:MAG: VWA domain-containing protein [Acidobacteriota bacterium]